MSFTALPSSFDWRNHNGANWMTPVKDQSGCGGCWAFATVGAVEAKVKIDANNPDLYCALSDQQLISCCHNIGPGCDGGSPAWGLDYATVVLEYSPQLVEMLRPFAKVNQFEYEVSQLSCEGCKESRMFMCVPGETKFLCEGCAYKRKMKGNQSH